MKIYPLYDRGMVEPFGVPIKKHPACKQPDAFLRFDGMGSQIF